MANKQITLWSWLVKSETKEEFRCPPGLRVTNEEFAAELARWVAANQLPAQVELCEVNWDDTNTKQTRAVVRYTGSDARTDVVRLLVGVDQMGNFAYVERKSYLRPPQLPKVPRERKMQISSASVKKPKIETDDSFGGCLVDLLTWVFLIFGGLGIAQTVFGVLMAFSTINISYLLNGVVPGLMFLVGWRMYKGRRQKRLAAEARAQAAFNQALRNARNAESEAAAWNAAALQEQTAWNNTWDNWQREVLRAAYLAKTDDVFGRFTSAVSSCVDDVVKVLFVDRDAELRNKTEHAQTQEAIEKELQRRRSEAFS